jgi:prephenate dehydrogenase
MIQQLSTKKTLGIIGLGSFARFFIPHLKPYFEIFVYDQRDLKTVAIQLDTTWESLEAVCQKEIVMAGVPILSMEKLIAQIAEFINPDCLFMDICSVKVKPVEWMSKYLPSSVEIMATHPLFGPQSGKNGIKGLNIVLCPVRVSKHRADWINALFAEALQLNVLERTPVIHDKQMAFVQALTHFVGRAVNEMDIPDVEQKTPAYQYLLDIKRNLGQDSWDLFLTIENGNPFAKEVREQFIEELTKLNNMLD